jgi:hypothetical protein
MDSDFMTWKLNDGRCTSGRVTTYIRKKVGAVCSMHEATASWTRTSDCECTVSDYGCSWGYSKNSDGICIKDSNFLNADASPYLKLPGNSCSGGIDIKDLTEL